MLYENLDPNTVIQAQGIFDTVQGLSEEASTTLRVVAGVVAVGFFIFVAVAKRFALGAMLVGGLAAGVFMWMVFNVTTVQEKVGEDIDRTQAMIAVDAPEVPVT